MLFNFKVLIFSTVTDNASRLSPDAYGAHNNNTRSNLGDDVSFPLMTAQIAPGISRPFVLPGFILFTHSNAPSDATRKRQVEL